MKKLTLWALLALCSMTAQAQKELVIKVQLKNYQPTDTLTLSWGANNKSMNQVITTITQSNDNEEITIPLNEPRLLVLAMKRNSGSLDILASPGETISISGRLRGNSSQKNTLDKVKVTGASLQTEYTTIVEKFNEKLDSLDKALNNDFGDIISLMARSKETKNEQNIADMYKTQHGKQYVNRVTEIYNEKNLSLERVVGTYKNNFMGPLLMLKLAGRLDKSYRLLYDMLDENAKQSYYGREVKDEVYPPTLVGDMAPTVTVKNVNGNEKILSFAHHGNHYLLLDFWASWCEPCRKEVPNLKQLYEKYHGKGLDIIGISADQNMEDWKEALDELKEPWCNYIDISRQSISEYKVQYIPSIFIMDSKGQIIAEKLRGTELFEFVSNLFKEE